MPNPLNKLQWCWKILWTQLSHMLWSQFTILRKTGFRTKFIHFVSTDHQVQFLNGFTIFHKPKHTQGLWKIAKKPNHIVKFGCGNGCVKLYFFQKMRFFFKKIVKITKKMIKIFFLSKKYTLVPKLSYMFYEKYFTK